MWLATSFLMQMAVYTNAKHCLVELLSIKSMRKVSFFSVDKCSPPQNKSKLTDSNWVHNKISWKFDRFRKVWEMYYSMYNKSFALILLKVPLGTHQSGILLFHFEEHIDWYSSRKSSEVNFLHYARFSKSDVSFEQSHVLFSLCKTNMISTQPAPDAAKKKTHRE